MKIEGKITFKNLEALSLEKLTYSPNQGTVEESLVIRCAEPDMINDCQESNANSDKEQTSSQEEAYLQFTDPSHSLLKHFITLGFAYCITNLS